MASNGAFTASKGDVTVAVALLRLQAWNVAIAKAGREIIAQGSSIPCDVRSRHNRAASEYLRAARAVFTQLAARNIPVTQKVVDFTGKERTLAPAKENPFPAPVAPLTFVVSDCKGADQGLGVPLPLVMIGAVVVLMLARAGGLCRRPPRFRN